MCSHARLDGWVISGHVPYSKPCYTYRGVPLAAVIPRREHNAEIDGFAHGPGTLRLTASHTLPPALVEQLLDVRMRLIDERLDDAI